MNRDEFMFAAEIWIIVHTLRAFVVNFQVYFQFYRHTVAIKYEQKLISTRMTNNRRNKEFEFLIFKESIDLGLKWSESSSIRRELDAILDS